MVGGSEEGKVRKGDYRNYYKGHMDKIKGEEGGGGGRGGQLGWGGVRGRQGTQLSLNNNKKLKLKIMSVICPDTRRRINLFGIQLVFQDPEINIEGNKNLFFS